MKTIAEGEVFERLVSVSEPYFISTPIPSRPGRLTKVVDFICVCGAKTTQPIYAVLKGSVKSCGCLFAEGKNGLRHGETGTPIHNVWGSMKQRCSNPNHPEFKHYGGRGISVCNEWNSSYESFRDWAIISGGYSSGLLIDRVNVNGNYEPVNCRFVDTKKSARNRTDTIYLTAFEETKSMVDWVDDSRCSVNYGALESRIRLGWDHESAISLPKHARCKR